MAKYVSLVNLGLGSFKAWQLEHILRNSNEKVDTLAAITVSLPIKETMLLPMYYLLESSITTSRVHEIDETGSSWMTPIVLYLSSRELLDNIAEAHKIQDQAARFSLVNNQLYKRSLGEPYLKCLTHQLGQYILVELHDGICGNHPGGMTLAHRDRTKGYYWPTMHADAVTHVKKCDHCQ